MRYGLALLSLLPALAWAEPTRIAIQAAYGAPGGFVAEGRVYEEEAISAARERDGRFRNLRRSARALKQSEREMAFSLQLGDVHWPVSTDDEGYFRIEATATLAPGWHVLSANAAHSEGQARLLIVPPENRIGIVSDIDDTVLVSDVPNKRRLLSNTLTKNPLQRQAVPGMGTWYRSLLARNPSPEAAPMFYVSASPRQLSESISLFLHAAGYPEGVLITKQLNGSGKDPLTNQRAYKTAKIEALFLRYPDVKWVLVGDDGEQDPETYHGLYERYRDRIEGIYIRRVHPNSRRARFPEQREPPV